MTAAPRTNVRLQAMVVIAGFVLMAIKFTAWVLTRSNAILSDALESIVNVTAGLFALYSLWLAAQPRDREHPYGHGKIEYISAGIEGGLVMVAGGLIIWGAVQALIEGRSLHDLGIGIVLTSAAGALNLVMGLGLVRRGKRMHSLTMEASGAHLLSDAWSTVAMVTGLFVIWITGVIWLDQVFAILFAFYIIYTGLHVFRRSVAGIMDEADLELAGSVIGLLDANRQPAWIDLHNFRMIKYGAVLHIDCHVTLPWYYSLSDAHREISAIEELVAAKTSREVELFIHMDPCIPASCAICTVADCAQRKAPEARRVPWALDTVLANLRHSVDTVAAPVKLPASARRLAAAPDEPPRIAP